MARHFASSVVGFDDFPFARSHRGDVGLVGVVYTGLRLDGVITGRVRRDGVNATTKLAQLVQDSKFAPQVKLLMLQGIALGGFNVVDIHSLHELLKLPVLVVARRAPDLKRIESALRANVPGGERKWRLIERAGAMEPAAGVYVQRAGLTLKQAVTIIESTAICGRVPEPLRVAHLIAGGIADGQSRGRA